MLASWFSPPLFEETSPDIISIQSTASAALEINRILYNLRVSDFFMCYIYAELMFNISNNDRILNL